ncbi:MAG: hypothetical protein A2Z14_16190 [Chloroflexi bacterium RBG_16_48_8]|nr:MAG: hypothetical protein A2Z14_16190 [Chloroflexi bacterium RBG_16_48_8]
MNSTEYLAPIATILSGITAGIIIVSDDLRLRLGMLVLQYVCVTGLISLTIPLNISIIKLAAGWVACLVIGITIAQKDRYRALTRVGALPTGWVFRMIAVLMISTSAIGIGQFSLIDLLGIRKVSVASTLLLIGLGILQIGLTEDPIGVGMGLLIVISGFEILYSALEPSLAVMALMASIHIGIALVVSIISIDVKEHGDREVSE